MSIKQILQEGHWSRFFSVVDNMADTLNSRKDRMDKSDIIEQAFALFSDGHVAWVDEVGHDHFIHEHTSEMKSQKFCLFTKGGSLMSKTKTIKIMNSLGDASMRTKEQVINFDFLVLVDTGSEKSYSIAYIHKDDIREEWLDFSKDGVSGQFPTDSLTFVITPGDIRLSKKNDTPCYKEFKRQAQRNYIESF